MRNYYLTALSALIISAGLFSCNTGEGEGYDRERVEQEISNLSSQLSAQGASLFATALQSIDPDEIGAEELTVFAVSDAAYSTRAAGISRQDIMRHIVKGRKSQSKLVSDGSVEALNGETLVITEVDGEVYVNGVQIQLSRNVSNSTLFFIDEEIQTYVEPSEIITIHFLGQISIMNPFDGPGHEHYYLYPANVPVRIYNSSGKILFTGYSDEYGICEIHLEDITADDLTDMTYDVNYPGYSNLYDGWIVADYAWYVGAWDNVPPYPEGYPKYSNGLIFRDINGDGVIDHKDKVLRAPLVFSENSNTSNDNKILLVPDTYEWPRTDD